MQDYIEPSQWEQQWSKEQVKFLKRLIADIRYSFDERDHDVCFYLVYRGTGKNAYISMGIRKQGKQANGNSFSFLCAFGFFHDAALRWIEQPGWIDGMADRAVHEYQRFLDGTWPINKIHDQDVMDRTARLMGEDDPLS